ncbi:MAG: hypothetical protein KKH94_07625 [Candidatus Omnitrophica bacterium]|nr:hypothetical protein [Candidatus Omnitrophota bacterium]
MRKFCHCCLIIVLTIGFIPQANALDVESLTSVETISAQSVRGDDVISPYHVTGESLVRLIQKMGDFDIAGSNVIFNRRTAQLFIRTTPSNHDVIEKVLTDLRKANYLQVELEARMITVSSTDIDDIGLDFIGIDQKSGNDTRFYGTDRSFNDGTYTTNVDFPNVTTAGGADLGGQLAFATLASEFDLQGAIDALRSRAEVNTLSAPRLIVANNQRANIRVEKAEYYIQSVETDSETGSANSLAVDPQVGIAQSGTILDVTPTINADGTITLELHPVYVTADLTNTQTIDTRDGLTTAQKPEITLPVFTIQTADTTVTVENGGVAMIGGLIEEKETKGDYKIPLLGDIPFIGKLLFQSSQVQEVKTHLVIFVKAKIKNTLKGM